MILAVKITHDVPYAVMMGEGTPSSSDFNVDKPETPPDRSSRSSLRAAHITSSRTHRPVRLMFQNTCKPLNKTPVRSAR